MSTPDIRTALERLVSAYAACQGQYEEMWPLLLDDPMAACRAALADVQPHVEDATRSPVQAAETLAARPLLEKVARLGDCIGQQTVAQVQQLAEQAAAWLRNHPPGQPVAIEPRGCPTPGACSCVEPTPPAPEPGEVAELADRLGWIAAQLGDIGWGDDSVSVARAATLLQQLSAHAIPLPQAGEVSNA